MLSGDRWGWSKPRDWDRTVRQAQAKIVEDHNCTARKRQKRRHIESVNNAEDHNCRLNIARSESRPTKRPRATPITTPAPRTMRIELPADDPFVDTLPVQTGQSAEFNQWSKSSNDASLPATRSGYTRIPVPPSNHARISTPEQSPLLRRRSSSARMQRTAVKEIATLRRRIETLERNAICHSDLNHWSVVLETAVLDQVRAWLAKRDAEIEALKAKLASQK
jgi:hypothetical protein